MASRSNRTGVARRYAFAIFELAEEFQAVPDIMRDLDAFRTCFHESPELRHLILNPAYSLETKKTALADVFARGKLHSLSKQFLCTLLDNERIGALDEVCRIYDTLQFQKGYKKTVVVHSAFPLTPDQRDHLTATIHEKLAQDVDLEVQTDPSLIAGIVVDLGGTRIDSTLKTKLDKLSTFLKGARA